MKYTHIFTVTQERRYLSNSSLTSQQSSDSSTRESSDMISWSVMRSAMSVSSDIDPSEPAPWVCGTLMSDARGERYASNSSPRLHHSVGRSTGEGIQILVTDWCYARRSDEWRHSPKHRRRRPSWMSEKHVAHNLVSLSHNRAPTI